MLGNLKRLERACVCVRVCVWQCRGWVRRQRRGGFKRQRRGKLQKEVVVQQALQGGFLMFESTDTNSTVVEVRMNKKRSEYCVIVKG